MKKVLFDMDGVVVDFVGAALTAHGQDPDMVKLPSNLNKISLEDMFLKTPKQFWAPIDNFEFWSGLAKTPEADRMVAAAVNLFGEAHVGFLTAPSSSEFCFRGKKACIEQHWPTLKENVIFAQPKAKSFLAAPDRYLIDDKNENVDGFRAAGGRAVLMPRYWNREHSRASSDNTDYIIACLNAWKVQG